MPAPADYYHNYGVALRLGLAAFSLAVLLAGVLLPDRPLMERWFEHAGFFFVFATFALLVATLLRGLDKPACLAFCRAHGPAGLLALVLTVAVFCAAPPKFRILFDEANLAAVAMDMYQRHGAGIPENGYFAGGSYHSLTTTLDKRPLAFPFLTYAAHSLTGYRTSNGFVVNFCAGLGALLAISVLLRRWLDPASGALGQLLLAAFPLFALWTASNGFEILNLFFILLAFLFFDEFLVARTAAAAEKCLLTLLVLAQCRYESVLFLCVFVPLLAIALPRAEYRKLSPLALLAPVLLAPVLWQQILFFRAEDHQLDAGGALFGIRHLFANVANALEALRGADSRYGQSAPTFYLALGGLVWAGRAGLRDGWLRQPRVLFLLAAAALSYAPITAIQLAYHLGDLTAPTTQRLAIIYLPLLVLPAVYCLYRLSRVERVGSWLSRCLPAACVGLLVFLWPVAGKNQAVAQLNAFHSYERGLEFVTTRYPQKNVLLVAERAHLYLIHGYSAVNFHFASDNFAALAEMQRKGMFQAIVAIQERLYADTPPAPDFQLKDQNKNEAKLETLYQEQLDPRKMLRIARVLVD